MMLAKALSELGELYPAVEAAEKAVRLDSTWSIGWQTLARAQIGLGELDMVRINECRSVLDGPILSSYNPGIVKCSEISAH